MTRIGILLLAAICGSAQTLRQAADQRMVKAGTSAQYSLLTDSTYTTVMAREYSQLEPENDMKWDTIHPGQTTYAFGNGDGLVSFASSHGMAVRGHTLVWHNQNPAWLTNGNFAPAQLSTILQDHIYTVMGHYAGKLYAWDVVNEAFNDDGTLRSTIWHDQPGIGLAGTAYIEQAFRWAHTADAAALLFINDYSAEGLSAKSNAIFALVKDFKSRNVPIHGVGLQMHLTAGGISISDLDANIKRLTDLGLQVQFTELDVRLPVTNSAASAADLAAQATTYHDVVAVCLKYPLCTAIQTWGFTDKYSWIPSSFPGFGAALPLDASYQPKPAYTSIQAAFATTPPSINATSLLNAGSYSGGAVSPGEIVTLFGANYGPATLATATIDASGRLANTLAGTRLYFDGVPAPLVYAFAGQSSFIVPYEVQNKTSTQVQYEYNSVRSNTVSVPVAATAPSLFTASSQGSGPGAILNVDYSYNSASNPAPKGGVVLLFGTGEGQTNPTGVDGQLAGVPYPAPLAKVSVTIDGKPADVIYAGAAPTLVQGLFQLDVVIPPTASSGAVAVIVTVGDKSSQTGVTVAVR